MAKITKKAKTVKAPQKSKEERAIFTIHGNSIIDGSLSSKAFPVPNETREEFLQSKTKQELIGIVLTKDKEQEELLKREYTLRNGIQDGVERERELKFKLDQAEQLKERYLKIIESLSKGGEVTISS